MNVHLGWLALVVVAFLAGAYLQVKYPAINVVGKMTGEAGA